MLRRITSLMLAMVMVGSCSGAPMPGAGIGSDSHGEKTEPGNDVAAVKADDLWYEAYDTVLFGQADISSYDRISFMPDGSDDNGYAFSATGIRKPADDTDRYSGDFDYSEYSFREIFTYSAGGDILGINDAADMSSWEQIVSEDAVDSEAFYSLTDGSITYHIGVETFEDKTAALTLYRIAHVEAEDEYEDEEREDDEESNESEVTRVVIAALEDVSRTSNGLRCGGSVPVTAAYLYSRDIFIGSAAGYMLIDTDTMEIKRIGCPGNVSAPDGASIFTVTEEGIYKYDVRNGKLSLTLDWNDCDICVNDAAKMYVVDVTHDEFILAGTGDGNTLKLTTLCRADDNPNEGKVILTLAYDGSSPDEALIEAVHRYNLSDGDAYVRLICPEGDETADIMTETFGHNGEWYEDGLYDLHELIGDDEAEGLLSGILDPDGEEAVYCLPTAISMEAIFASCVSEGIASEPSRTGFTYEEYDDAVMGSFGGVDPMGTGIRRDYFPEGLVLCRDLMSDEEGKFDVDSDALNALLDYCETVSPAIGTGASGRVDPLSGNGAADPVAGRLRSAQMLIGYFGPSVSDMRAYGMPSYDGRGPAIVVEHSLSVSSSADRGAASSFINYIISTEAQRSYSGRSVLPVNRAALEDEISEAAGSYNDMINRYLEYYSSEEAGTAGQEAATVDPEAAAEAVERAVASCGVMITSESAADSSATGSTAFPSLRIFNDPSVMLTPEEYEFWNDTYEVDADEELDQSETTDAFEI